LVTQKIALVSVLVAACTPQAMPPLASSESSRVRITRAEARPEERWLAGNVSAARHAQISTRAAAAVREVRVREGDRVVAGAVLVRLADGDLRAQEAAARAALDAALANERRVRSLVTQGHPPAAQLDSAEAQRAQAQAQLGAAREALTYAEIRAPFAGAVLAKLASQGDLVAPGQPMIELAGSALEIVANATEEETRALKAGLRLPFISGAARGEAEVTAVSPGADPVSHRGTVRALVVSGTALRPGDFARLRLPASPGSGRLWIPRSALVERGDLTGVFVVREGHAQLRWLAVGEQDGDAAWIRAGLTAEETLVERPGGLRDGDPVEVADGR
jgi:RND family efflux transporter MFP subunit